MITLRKSHERGHANYGWLDTYHSFSFANYYDPAHMGFSSLRVINDDRVAPAGGFPTHGHRDMEIITYVLDGVLEHKDSMDTGDAHGRASVAGGTTHPQGVHRDCTREGHAVDCKVLKHQQPRSKGLKPQQHTQPGATSVIHPGDVQRMSAGTGITHSEYNPSKTAPLHLLQIWIMPNQEGVAPSYEQVHFTVEQKRGRWCLIASPDGRAGSVTIHQDAFVYVTVLEAGHVLSHDLASGRRAYLHVARGAALLNGQALSAGDGARIMNETKLDVTTHSNAEILLFDLD